MGAISCQVPRILASALRAVHVQGESGTGKEGVAQLFRAALGCLPFVAISCAALAPELLEATLFGAVKGAFTGAMVDRAGVFEAASGGWLFLDEVACLTAAAQAALLRVLECGQVTRLGETLARSVDVRVLSATNEDLGELVTAGRFRRDLWQRLCELRLCLPPLRERRQEIPAIIDAMLAELTGGPWTMDPELRGHLAGQTWCEGNVRQLRSCLRAMTAMASGQRLTMGCLPEGDSFPWWPTTSARRAGDTSATGRAALAVQLPGGPRPFDFCSLTERLLLASVEALRQQHRGIGLRGLAAELGMSRSALARRLARSRRLFAAEGA